MCWWGLTQWAQKEMLLAVFPEADGLLSCLFVCLLHFRLPLHVTKQVLKNNVSFYVFHVQLFIQKLAVQTKPAEKKTT